MVVEDLKRKVETEPSKNASTSIQMILFFYVAFVTYCFCLEFVFSPYKGT